MWMLAVTFVTCGPVELLALALPVPVDDPGTPGLADVSAVPDTDLGCCNHRAPRSSSFRTRSANRSASSCSSLAAKVLAMGC